MGLYGLGNTLLAAGQAEAAADAFLRACDLCNDHALHELAPMPYTNLGVALHRLGRFDEAFGALRAGAAALKLFPAEAMPPEVLKAWRAVIPDAVPLIPVGGITPERIAGYVAAGASGFGLGSALYRAGDAPEQVSGRADRFVQAWHAAHGRVRT